MNVPRFAFLETGMVCQGKNKLATYETAIFQYYTRSE